MLACYSLLASYRQTVSKLQTNSLLASCEQKKY